MKAFIVALMATLALTACGAASHTEAVVVQHNISRTPAQQWWDEQPKVAQEMFCELFHKDPAALEEMMTSSGTEDDVSPDVAEARLSVMKDHC